MIFEIKSRGVKYCLFIITWAIFTKETEAGRDRGVKCEKPDYIQNGSYRIRRDRVMRINCNAGFTLQGSKTIDCVLGKWEGDKPVCAKKGCKKDLEQPENGRIQIENDLKAILYCSDNYNLAGNRHSYCNGTDWDRPIGNCREHKNLVQHECDFETDDICGWTYEPKEGLEWKRVMAGNVFTTFKTGPRHDHTTFSANGGHYMLMESLTKQNDDVILTSPIYDRDLSLKTACCFQFYYFMYGGGVGDLYVVVKPVSLELDEILKYHKDLIKFKKYGNQNNIWNEAHFNIEELKEDFQILFVASSGSGKLSDIAVDDVKLMTGDDCRPFSGNVDEDLSNEEYDATTYESIFEMESCVGHCFESPGKGIFRQSNHLKGRCNCDLDCEDNETCCPDFRAVCLNELFSESTPLAETNEAAQKNNSIKNNNSTTNSITPTTIATTKITLINSTSTTAKTTIPTTTKTATKTTTPTTTSTTTSTTTTPTTTTTRTTTTTTTTPKSTTTTIKTTPTTIKTTLRTTITSTTPKPIIIRTTKTTTTRATTPRTTTRIARSTTTKRRTTLSTTSTRKPTAYVTTQKTTVATMKILKTTTPTTPTSATSHIQKTTAKISPETTSKSTPRPTPKSIEYVITDKTKKDSENKGFSFVLIYIFLFIVVLVLAGSIYKSFGDRAVAWYMIRFKHNTQDDEDSSSVTTSFKQSETKTNEVNGTSRTKWRVKSKKSFNTKNIMKAPLVDYDDEDDEDDTVATNGNIALKNNIYTEL